MAPRLATRFNFKQCLCQIHKYQCSQQLSRTAFGSAQSYCKVFRHCRVLACGLRVTLTNEGRSGERRHVPLRSRSLQRHGV